MLWEFLKNNCQCIENSSFGLKECQECLNDYENHLNNISADSENDGSLKDSTLKALEAANSLLAQQANNLMKESNSQLTQASTTMKDLSSTMNEISSIITETSSIIKRLMK